jgi:predicted glycosyltransferase involved in capsule biosynthesis
LEHLSLGQLPRGVGRSTYRSLGHFVKKMPKLRALDVREVAEFSHKWRLKCGLQLAQYGHEKLEVGNLFPFYGKLELKNY